MTRSPGGAGKRGPQSKENQQRVLELYRDGVEREAIAERLRISRGTVSKYIARARKEREVCPCVETWGASCQTVGGGASQCMACGLREMRGRR